MTNLRKNLALVSCFLSLAIFAGCYGRHWISLSGALICASLIWQFTSWWLAGRLKAVFKENALKFVQQPTSGIARTIDHGSMLLCAASLTAWIVTGVN